MSETKIMTTCGGEIDHLSRCKKCGQISQTSSAWCIRLIELRPIEPSQDELWEEILRDCIGHNNHLGTYLDTEEAKKRYRITRVK